MPPRTHANITVVGQDRAGVVARVTSFLFEKRANVEALEARVRCGLEENDRELGRGVRIRSRP